MTNATDSALLNELSHNSRKSYRQIAKSIGKSPTTVLTRMKELEKKKVITGYSVELDYDLLGYEIPVIIEINIAKGKLLEVEKKIAKHKNVVSVYDTIGSYDALVFARFKTRRSLDEFVKKLQTYDFVEHTQTHLILNTIVEKKIGL